MFLEEVDNLKADLMDQFILHCCQLGNWCPLLSTVTEVCLFADGTRYRVINIIRRGTGRSVKDVIPGRGFGMEARGGNDDPFPDNSAVSWL